MTEVENQVAKMKKYFGTDGVRGTANSYPITADLAVRLGQAAGLLFTTKSSHRHRVVIAKDTRLSGYLLEPALTAGFISAGMDVILVGPMPTPAVAMLTKSMRADLGVMISASHNPYHDNGIKLFAPDGYKLSDEVELEIEAIIDSDIKTLATPSKLGRAKRLESAGGRYIEFVKSSFPKHLKLDGMKIVIDCANGSGYKVGPIILSELGADVIPIGVKPDGFNINKNCGSTDTTKLQKAVVKHSADIGIALDGDADRVIMCDENGDVINGDHLMALIATYLQKKGDLRGDTVVATQMSNLGLEFYLETKNLKLVRTDVGDRYVIQKMREEGCNMGGEQSGHIILSDYSTTGDALIAGLHAIAAILESGESPSEITKIFTPVPQILKNVRCEDPEKALKNKAINETIKVKGEELKRADGRLFIRKSGTEPLIRIMAEGRDEKEIERVVCEIAEAVEGYTKSCNLFNED